jgi:LacI family transcriptional regulator
MKRRVTMKDVADAIGVHVSTVSRALDPKTSHRIRPEMTEQIRQACRELGYRQTVTAYSLRANRTRTVGVVIPDILDPFFGPIIQGAEYVLSDHDYLAVLANVDGQGSRGAEIADALLARRVEGLMLVSGAWRDDAVARLAGAATPIVTLHRTTDDPRVSTVVHDEEEGIRLLLEHLVSLGHRRIAHIAGPQSFTSGLNRYRAFESQRQRLGLDQSPGLISFADRYNESAGEQCADVLTGEMGVTAIVCANDRLAIGAITALRRRGLDCPRDVSVTGYNDMLYADRVVPALTTVRTDQHRQGVEAAEILVEMMETAPEEREPQHIVLPVEIVIRDSTRAVRD